MRAIRSRFSTSSVTSDFSSASPCFAAYWRAGPVGASDAGPHRTLDANRRERRHACRMRWDRAQVRASEQNRQAVARGTVFWESSRHRCWNRAYIDAARSGVAPDPEYRGRGIFAGEWAGHCPKSYMMSLASTVGSIKRPPMGSIESIWGSRGESPSIRRSLRAA